MKTLKAAAALIALTTASLAQGASILLVPTSQIDFALPGDLLTFDVVMDFTDYPNGTIGGGFDIVYDTSTLAFSSFFRDPSIGEVDFSRDPDILPGLLESWAVAAFVPLPPFAILGSVTFEALTQFGDSFVGTQATQGIGGPWVDGTTFVDLVPVEYGLVTFTTIPVPGAVWLLLGALGWLGVLKRLG